MTIYFFDVRGTLEGKVGGLGEDQCAELLQRLSAAGHEVIIWSSLDVPERFRSLGQVRVKEWSHYMHMFTGARQCVVVDDDDLFLAACSRFGAKAIHASQLPEWHAGIEPCDWILDHPEVEDRYDELTYGGHA